MIKCGIIGCGNMGGAILRQMLKAGVFKPEEVCAADRNEALLRALHAETGVCVTDDNAAAAVAPLLILALKPQFMESAVAPIRDRIAKEALIISIAAGYDLKMLKQLVGNEDAHIVRVMPNTPAMVGAGVMAACRSESVTKEEWTFASKILESMGLMIEVMESHMDAVTGMSGSSPAFVFLFMEALADAGVRGGLPRADALKMAAQVIMGCGKLALETGKHPGQLKDMVTSPAGTTIEGVAVLEKRGFRGAVMEAVEAATEKSKALRK